MNNYCRSLLLNFHLFLLLLLLLVAQIVQGRPRPMGEALQRAIERTKQFQATDRDRRQRPALTQTALKARQIQPARQQRLDVEKLNRLLKTLDKSWIMPRAGVHEPVGSNFQYKKTCASIYKARPNACDQLGFGVMCFNFCYEQGESLEFRCEDASDSQFCQTHSNYESFMGKHKKDAYRAKAYIHQQLTRCYMSSVCNGALLDISLLRGPKNMAQIPLHLRALHRSRPTKVMSNAALVNISAELETLFPEKEGWERHSTTAAGRRRWKPAAVNTKKEEYQEEEDGGGFDAPEEPKKYVPFWQRLLVRKKAMQQQQKVAASSTAPPPPPPPELTVEEDAEEEERRWLEQRFGRKLEMLRSSAAERASKNRHSLGTEATRADVNEATIFPTGRRMPSMEPPIGFWTKFQPGKWFQSIHYITNTG